MSTLINMREYPINQNLLLDAKWKETDYYELYCKSELWGGAFLVVLDKQQTSTPNEAVIYLLERLIIESEGWDEKIQSDTDKDKDFREFIFAGGYLSDQRGWNIPNDGFWKNYDEIKNGISSIKDFLITKNCNPIEDHTMTKREELLSVVSFANNWNNRAVSY